MLFKMFEVRFFHLVEQLQHILVRASMQAAPFDFYCTETTIDFS